jgi:hypothetical protein
MVLILSKSIVPLCRFWQGELRTEEVHRLRVSGDFAVQREEGRYLPGSRNNKLRCWLPDLARERDVWIRSVSLFLMRSTDQDAN